MHSLHADDSPALPTRRSRRVSHASSSSPDVAPSTRRERNYSPEQPLTRAQMRQARLEASGQVGEYGMASSAYSQPQPTSSSPSVPEQVAPLTRAQLRARALAEQAIVPEVPAHEAPVAVQPQNSNGQLPPKTLALQPLRSDSGLINAETRSASRTARSNVIANAEDAAQAETGTQNVIEAVRAVVEEVERRVSVASNNPTNHEMVILSHGTEELVDTNAPGCDVHGTAKIPAVEVYPGTSVAVNPKEVPVPRLDPATPALSFEEALNLKSSEHEHSSVISRTQHGSARVGALARVSQPARDDANARNRNQWASRIAVLSTIGLATIGVPLLANGSETGSIQASDGSIDLAASGGPTTIEFLNDAQQRSDIPNSIALSITEDERAVLVASRSDDRGTLDNCDGTIDVTSGNGLLGSDELCTVMGVQIQPEAAVAFTELNKAFTARFGHEMCITSGYRSLAQQYSVKAQKGSLAATPGRSNHGFGNAVDLCPTSYQSAEKWNWLHETAPTFGWDLPGWASRSYEPWHWEYTSGVEATNAY